MLEIIRLYVTFLKVFSIIGLLSKNVLHSFIIGKRNDIVQGGDGHMGHLNLDELRDQLDGLNTKF